MIRVARYAADKIRACDLLIFRFMPMPNMALFAALITLLLRRHYMLRYASMAPLLRWRRHDADDATLRILLMARLSAIR